MENLKILTALKKRGKEKKKPKMNNYGYNSYEALVNGVVGMALNAYQHGTNRRGRQLVDVWNRKGSH